MSKNPQKIIAGRYHAVPRTLILIIEDNQLLMQKGAADKKIWAGLYNGLGGHVEKGEDILSAAQRELFEEAGITCGDLKLFGIVNIDVNIDEGIIMFVFLGRSHQGELINSEEGQLEWVKIEKLSEIPIVEDIPVILSKIADAEPGQIFFGHYSYNEQGEWIAKFN